MEALKLMYNSPWITFLFGLIIMGILNIVLSYLINRPLRHRNIKLHGYPPEHCDADGDFKDEDKD